MTIFKTINKDHESQREMMAILVNTEGSSETRIETFKQFVSEYRAHAAAEEQVFYAELMQIPEGTDEARHSVAEHQETLKLLEELENTDMSSPGWLPLMKKVQHDNEHHMEEEEKDVFPSAEKLLSNEQMKKMSDAFNSRKTAEQQ